jgi:hypothetical protein
MMCVGLCLHLQRAALPVHLPLAGLHQDVPELGWQCGRVLGLLVVRSGVGPSADGKVWAYMGCCTVCLVRCLWRVC